MDKQTPTSLPPLTLAFASQLERIRKTLSPPATVTLGPKRPGQDGHNG